MPKDEPKPNQLEPKVTTEKPAMPTIYVLAERIPAHPVAGEKASETVHHKLGYWTERHIADIAAVRHNLSTIILSPAVNPGEVIV